MIKSSPFSSMTASINRIALVLLLIFIVGILPIFLLMNVSPTQAAVNCNDNSWNVGNTNNLNSAITCFNGKTVAGSYTISVTQNISLTTSGRQIDNTTTGVFLVVEGNGFTIDGQQRSGVRPFNIDTSTRVTINKMTIIGGRGSTRGGGIENRGRLTINNSRLSDNSASSMGGAIFSANSGRLEINNSTFSDNSGNSGGAINNNGGQLIVNNSTFLENNSGNGGAIVVFGNATVSNSTFSGNSAATGGAIATVLPGNLTIINSTLVDNSASSNGGALYNTSGSVSVNNSIIANNAGGNCYNSISSGGFNLVSDNTCGFFQTGDKNNTDPLLGPLANNGGSTWTYALLSNSPAIDAGSTDLTNDQRGGSRPQGSNDDIGAFELYDCTTQPWLVSNEIELNDAIGCYNNVTVADTYTISVTQNISLTISSTAIYNESAGVALLLEGNRFAVDGHGNAGVRPFTIGPNTTATLQNITIMGGNMVGSGNGGGVANLGLLTIKNSAVVGNSAFDGGAIYNNDGILTVHNSTISSNFADNGGGIYNFGTITVTSSTLSDNYANNNGNGIYNDTGTITVSNNILANQSNGNCSGTMTSDGYNLANDNSCNLNATGDMNNTNPLHVSVIDSNNNWTYALLPGSPAIDAGNTTLTTDQRGIARPQGAADDIGAFESQGFVLTANAANNIVALSAMTSTSQTTLINTPFPNPLSLTVSSSNDEPVAGGLITFTAPASGASVTFTETAVTIATNGTVNLPVTANGTAGSYEVTADTPGNTGEPLVYYLTNTRYTTFLPMIVGNSTGTP